MIQNPNTSINDLSIGRSIRKKEQLSLRRSRSYCSFNYTTVIHHPQYKSGLKVKQRK